MWVLTQVPSQPAGATAYRLTSGKHTIGRKGCAIALTDKSVSRLHAELVVVHAKEHLAQPDQRPVVTIVDRSRFGTMRNDVRLPAGEQVELAEGDELKFGVYQDAFRLSFEPLVVYWGSRSSDGDGIAFSREEQASILKSLHMIGAHVAYEPDGATISVIKEIAVPSLQLLHSYIRALPIVTPAYLQAILDRHALYAPLPSYADYIPPVARVNNVQATRIAKAIENELRNGPPSTEQLGGLFDGKSFVLLSPRQSELGKLITALGGEVIEAFREEKDMRFYRRHRKACVILPPEIDMPIEEDVTAAGRLKQFKSLGVVPIDPVELSAAIIYRDASTYCNPQHADTAEPSPTSNPGMMEVIALDSEGDDLKDEDEPSLILVAESNPTTKEAQTKKRKEPPQSESQTRGVKAMNTDLEDRERYSAKLPQPHTNTDGEDKHEHKAGGPQQKKRKESDLSAGMSVFGKGSKKEPVEEREDASKEAPTHDAEHKPANEVSAAEPLMTTAYKRLIVRPAQSGVVNFKKFKKAGGTRDAATSQTDRARRVIACEEDDGKPSNEMAAWLKDTTEEEKENTKSNTAADVLWDATPRPFPSRSVGEGGKRTATTFSLTRHARSASSSAAMPPSSTDTAGGPGKKKTTTRRKTTFV